MIKLQWPGAKSLPYTTSMNPGPWRYNPSLSPKAKQMKKKKNDNKQASYISNIQFLMLSPGLQFSYTIVRLGFCLMFRKGRSRKHPSTMAVLTTQGPLVVELIDKGHGWSQRCLGRSETHQGN